MTTDEEAEAFLDKDLSNLDPAQFRAFVWETAPKTARVNMRLPEGLITAVKARAAQRGIPYQRLIREALEREVGRKGGDGRVAPLSNGRRQLRDHEEENQA
jgi:predicted DNA binding CopG/RHH family protein